MACMCVWVHVDEWCDVGNNRTSLPRNCRTQEWGSGRESGGGGRRQTTPSD